MLDINHLCQYCLSEADMSETICPVCGRNLHEVPERSSRCLPQYTILAGRYLAGRVLGEGGFGITYLAMDLISEERVAVKEYFPVDIAARDARNLKEKSVSICGGEAGVHFQNGMRRFEEEARTLRRLELLPGIVSVRDFFTENNTAYLVMEYIEGGNLKNFLKLYRERQGQTLPWQQAFGLMRPVLASLQKIHAAGIIHRDISPENILVNAAGQLVLIDFGSARTNQASQENRSVTVMVKHGYAPEEQYRTHGEQGPWTDVYAACATLYHMISGILPEDAIERLVDDRLVPLKQLSLQDRVPAAWSDIVEKGMQLRAADRYPSMDALLADLDLAERAAKSTRQTKETGRSAGRKRVTAGSTGQERTAEENAAPGRSAKKVPAGTAREKEQESRRPPQEDTARRGRGRIPVIAGVLLMAVGLAVLLPVLYYTLRSAPQTEVISQDGSDEDLIQAGSREADIVQPEDRVSAEKSPASAEESMESEEVTAAPAEAVSGADTAAPDEELLAKLEQEGLDSPAGASQEELAEILAAHYMKEEWGTEAALMWGSLAVRTGNSEYANKSFLLWGEYGACTLIDYRTQHIAAVKEDGTVCALGSPAGVNDYSATGSWENIVSVQIQYQDFYGLRCDGTLVCTDFNCEEFEKLTDVIQIEGIPNGHMAALTVDGAVFLDMERDGHMYRIEDPAWHDIRYIAGGYASLLGLREDGVIVEAYLPFSGDQADTVAEIAEITAYTGQGIRKMAGDGNVILLLDENGRVYAMEDPIGQYGTSNRFWLTGDDLQRIQEAENVADIAADAGSAVLVHEDGTVQAFGSLWFTDLESWSDVFALSTQDGNVFAILRDGTIRCFDPYILKEDYLRYTDAGEANQEFSDKELIDAGLAGAISWTGLRVYWGYAWWEPVDPYGLPAEDPEQSFSTDTEGG